MDTVRNAKKPAKVLNLLQDDVAILVISWDGFHDIWPPFFHCFFKYWPDCPYPVYLGTNTIEFSDNRVVPLLIGPDKDYSSNLIAMLDKISQKWVITWIDDFLLSGHIDTERFDRVIRLAQDHEAGYLKLITGTSTQVVLDGHNQDFGEIPKRTPYRVSMTVGLWRKNVLQQILRPGETAWDIELLGNERSFEIEDKFLCLVGKPLVPFVHGIRQGKWTINAVKFFRQEGLEEYIESRPVQSLWWRIYPKIRWYAPRFLVRLWQTRKARMLRK